MKAGDGLLLDTNVVIALFRQDPGVKEALKRAQHTFIPVIVAGELPAGAMAGSRVANETARVEAFFTTGTVVVCDLETAHYFAVVRDELRRKGTPIPENDMWIAALARQHNLTLATRDAHYSGINGLRTDPCLELTRSTRTIEQRRSPRGRVAAGAWCVVGQLAGTQRARRARPRA